MPAEKKSLPHAFRQYAHVAGIGLDNARQCATALIAKGIRHIIVAGVAGGLAAELKVGDVVVATRIRSRETGSTILLNDTNFCTEPTPTPTPTASATRFYGCILSSQYSVRAHEKPPLAKQHDAFAVDMESFAVAQVCQAAGCNVDIVRCISDDSQSDIPLAITKLIDHYQKVPILKLLLALVCEPSLMPKLVRMGKDYQRALSSLQQCEDIFRDISRGLVPHK